MNALLDSPYFLPALLLFIAGFSGLLMVGIGWFFAGLMRADEQDEFEVGDGHRPTLQMVNDGHRPTLQMGLDLGPCAHCGQLHARQSLFCTEACYRAATQPETPLRPLFTTETRRHKDLPHGSENMAGPSMAPPAAFPHPPATSRVPVGVFSNNKPATVTDRRYNKQ